MGNNDYLIEKNEYSVEQTLRGLYTIVAYFIITTIVEYILGHIFIKIGGDLTFLSSLLNFILYVLMATSIILINRHELKHEFLRMRKMPDHVSKIVIGFLALYFSSALISNFASMIEYGANYWSLLKDGKLIADTTSANQSTIVSMLNNRKTVLLMFLSAFLLGPFVEEAVFRRAIFKVIKKEEIAFILSSSLFAFIHIISSFGDYSFLSILLMFIEYFVSGFVLTLIYVNAHKNIWVSTIVHAAYNGISMLFILSLS